MLGLTSAIGKADVSCEYRGGAGRLAGRGSRVRRVEYGCGAGRLAGHGSRVRRVELGTKKMPEASPAREGAWDVVWLRNFR